MVEESLMKAVNNLLDMKVSDLKGPKRFYNESMEEYKLRRKAEKIFLKYYKRGKKGRIIWKRIKQ